MTEEETRTRYDVPIPVRLPEELREKIDQEAEGRSVSKSVVIREAIKYYFDHKEGTVVTEEEIRELIRNEVKQIIEEELRETFEKLTK